MALPRSVKPERTSRDVLTDALCKCNHQKKAKLSPFSLIEGDLRAATIHCTDCDAFLGYVLQHGHIARYDIYPIVKFKGMFKLNL